MISEVLFNFIGHFLTKYHSIDINVIKININKKWFSCLLYASEFYYFTIPTYEIAPRGCYHGDYEENSFYIRFITRQLLNDQPCLIRWGLQLNWKLENDT